MNNPLKDLTDKIVAYDTQEIDKFTKGVDKFCEQIDEECEEGEREVRFLTGKFTPSDITGEGKQD